MRASLASYMAVLMNRPPCKTERQETTIYNVLSTYITICLIILVLQMFPHHVKASEL